MFGVSFAELLVVMVVALLVFGPEKLPEIASQLGKLSFKLKRASDSFRREFYNSVYTPLSDGESASNTKAIESQATTPPACASTPSIPNPGLPTLYPENNSETTSVAETNDTDSSKKVTN